ncbi:MAG: hypothetical protein FJ279_04495 [Planctomycetes bacterium]|nr:hypothetical protein [Planctomycetota bacterium]
MRPDELVARHPHLYHMAADGAWPNILRRGLLSTTAILDLFGLTGDRRRMLEQEPRRDSVVLQTDSGERFVLRDQKPLHPGKLERCLIGMTVPEWLRLLNGKVFFWPTRKRCEQLLAARAYRLGAHTVIEVDTVALLQQHARRVSLSPINAGSTLHDPPRRGAFTFVPLADADLDAWRTTTGRRRAIAEVAVDYAVLDIGAVIRSVFRADSRGWTRIWDGGR